jgi:hypothetical protein
VTACIAAKSVVLRPWLEAAEPGVCGTPWLLTLAPRLNGWSPAVAVGVPSAACWALPPCERAYGS